MPAKMVNGIDVHALGEAIHEFRHSPALAAFRFRAHNEWLGEGGHSRTTISEFYGAGQPQMSESRPFHIEADEPPVLLGRDQGPNPVEVLISALAACLTGAMAYHAAARGHEIRSLHSEIEGEIDLRGFLGIAPEVRRGYQRIRVTFTADSDADASVLEECARFSPVLDVVMNGTVVDLQVKKAQAGRRAKAGQGAEEQSAPLH